VMAERQSSQS